MDRRGRGFRPPRHLGVQRGLPTGSRRPSRGLPGDHSLVPCGAARPGASTDTWQATYALRAGVEGTIDQALDTTGMRQARYRGLPKVILRHAFSATAINIIRLDAYRTSQRPHRPRTRMSRLSRLAA
ncbi:transposase [Kitasatospora sp. NPDC056138]|uniref:transposase n=1 Tax=Kitasatospora sp. NPDC056138 TaxID=3345724 RepID=UPI0035D80B4B